MPKGKAKTKFDYKKGTCLYSDGGYCNLPKYKQCLDCLYLPKNEKAYAVQL